MSTGGLPNKSGETDRALAGVDLISSPLLWSFLDYVPIPTFAIDLDHKIIVWNRALTSFTGVPASRMLGTDRVWSVFYEGPRPCMADVLLDHVDDPLPHLERWYPGLAYPAKHLQGAYEAAGLFPRWAAGSNTWIRFTATPVRDATGAVVAAIEILEDITAKQIAEHALRDSEARYRSLVESSSDGILLLDPDRRILSCNPAFLDLFGFDRKEQVLGQLTRIIHPSDDSFEDYANRFYPAIRARGALTTEWDLRRQNGQVLPAEMSTSAVRDADGRITKYVVTIRDISQRREQEERLAHLATHDPLTDLPNRVLFLDRLSMALLQARRTQQTVGVMFLDLDHFKQVNDSFGHRVGDQVLQAVSHRLRTLLRRGDTIGRVGGDEFVLMLPSMASQDNALVVARNLVEAFRRPLAVDDQEVQVGLSVGVALYPEDGENAETLLRNADTAMYRVKEQGRNGFRFHSSTNESLS